LKGPLLPQGEEFTVEDKLLQNTFRVGRSIEDLEVPAGPFRIRAGIEDASISARVWS
jgi:hypothetical protein